MSRLTISASETLTPFVGTGVERALDLEPGPCGGRADQLDHGEAVGQRAAAPVLRDVAEQPMLDLVPLRGAGRIVTDVDRQSGLVGKRLQLRFHSRTRAPFEPPQSAVIVSSLAAGSARVPCCRSQVRMDADGELGVSAVIPTLTQPSSAATS